MINVKRSMHHLAGWKYMIVRLGSTQRLGGTYLLIYRSWVMRTCGPDPNLSSQKTRKMCVIDAWTYYSGHVVTGPAGRVDRLICAWGQLGATNRKWWRYV
jgi:hypothetical protein